MVKKIIWLLVVVILGAGVAGISVLTWQKHQAPEYELVRVQQGDVTESVNLTGRVKSPDKVDLAFERGGRLTTLNQAVGGHVSAGGILAELDSSDLDAQLAQARANVEAELAKLSELKHGASPETIAVAQTAVSNAQRQLTEAQGNLAAVQTKNASDLSSAYADALTAAQHAMTDSKSGLLFISDLQALHFNDTASEEDNRLADAKAKAALSLLGVSGAGHWTANQLGPEVDGTYGRVLQAVIAPDGAKLDPILSAAGAVLQDLAGAFDAVPITDSLSSGEKHDLATAKSNAGEFINQLTKKREAINFQNSANQNTLTTAQANVTSASNALLASQQELQLVTAPPSSDQLAAQSAVLKAATAAAQSLLTQIAKTKLRSPISGIVTRQDLRVGEIIPPLAPVITVNGSGQYQVDIFIPEVDIPKIALNQTAKVTLEAYGNEAKFSARVVTIDPAATLLDGVATYKVTLEITGQDARIRPGMTANVEIVTAVHPRVLILPERALVNRNGQHLVQVIGDGQKIKEVAVQTGLQGSDGLVEITDGLKEGALVVVPVE